MQRGSIGRGRRVGADDKDVKIDIDTQNGIPIWLQLRYRLIYLISTGYFEPGDKLPTIRELAVSSGVNYNTVSKVYRDIERDGYIVTKRGCGTFVSQEVPQTGGAVPDEVAFLIREFVRQCEELGVPRQDIALLVEGHVLSGQ